MIFLDTSVFVSYLVEKDSNHPRAVELVNEIVSGKHGSAVTSDYVFDETVTVVLVRSKSLDIAVTAGGLIKESIAMIMIDEDIFENSWMMFKNQESTRFSFTDCTILTLVRENHIGKIATFDKEFKSSDSYEVIR
ncbi:MAG: PIN domain-containing protein [Thermoplasmatales archaeon]|nr:PIN domain-containing protein [Thermoplasmatales archaeon]